MTIDRDIILTPEQMSMYYMGYADGMKWLIAYLQEPNKRRRLPTQEEIDAAFKEKNNFDGKFP